MQPAEVEAVDADVAADEPGRAHVLPEAAGVADRDRAAERLQQAERRREDVAADEVEDDVHLLELAELVVGHASTAPSERGSSSFVRAPDRGDRGAVQRPDELDRRRADRAGGRGHEHARAEADPHELGQRDPRGEERHREGGALGEARLRRAEGAASARSTATRSA